MLPLIRIESPRSRRPSASVSSGTPSGRSGFGMNCGSAPSGTRSARFVSPSSANASLRIWSARPLSPSRLATVKSQAR